MALSSDVRVALGPAATYRQLLHERHDGSWLIAAQRPAFIALLIGSVMSIAAAGRVTLSLVAAETLAWTFAPVVQMIVGAIVIASAPRRAASMSRAMELLFLGHVPWSLWLLGAAAAVTLTRPPFDAMVLGLFAIVPIVWTIVIVYGFSRTVLQTSRRGAMLRVALASLTWVLNLAYIFAVSGIWARVLNVVGR